MSTSPAVSSELITRLRSLAWDFGFDHLAVAAPELPDLHSNAYVDWAADGAVGDMSYMTRDPHKRIRIRETYPGVQSVLTLGVSYYRGDFPPKPGPTYGRIARYAWGLDYHDVITARLKEFLSVLREIFGSEVSATLALDTKPLLERALAVSSGLGFMGKNTVLIIPRSNEHSRGFHVGSYVFLAEILLNISLVPTEKLNTDGCGGCTRCLESCPTKAFVGPYRLKADRCIAYLTIEHKGWIPVDMRTQIGDWIFGCDVCQEVCPFNARAFESRWPEFHPEKGAGAWLDMETILRLENSEFKARFGSTPLSRPKRRGLVRNACIAAGNSGEERLIPALQKLLSDSEPVVRGHALWALSRLMKRSTFVAAAENHLGAEVDLVVQEEIRRLLAA